MILLLSSHGRLEGSDEEMPNALLPEWRSVAHTPVPRGGGKELHTPASLRCLHVAMVN